MQVILLRHATRNTHELGDPPLNVVGLTQAQALVEKLKPNGPLPVPTVILSSPKKRARETLTPLSQSTGLAIVVDERIDERHQNESLKVFETRVQDLLASLAPREQKCILICSHLDWLESAFVNLTNLMEKAVDVSFGWGTAEFRVFEHHKSEGSQSGQWRLLK